MSFKNILFDLFSCQVGVSQGENLSLLLFEIYISDFDKFLGERFNGLTKISDSLSKELQVYLKIFCLLYVDGTLVLAESAKELQRVFGGLYIHFNKYALNVIIDKKK